MPSVVEIYTRVLECHQPAPPSCSSQSWALGYYLEIPESPPPPSLPLPPKYCPAQQAQTVQVKIELGHRASIRTKPTAEGYTHDWLVFVRGVEGSNVQHFLEKVVFHLHDSFPKPKRVVKDPPYQVEESGYGTFMLPIEIYFKNKEEPRKIRFEYDLFLHLEGSPPVNHIRCEKLTFQNPTEDFRRRLLKAGGVGVLGPVDFGPQTQPALTSGPGTPESKGMSDLFGAPIKVESHKKHKSHSKDKTPCKPVKPGSVSTVTTSSSTRPKEQRAGLPTATNPEKQKEKATAKRPSESPPRSDSSAKKKKKDKENKEKDRERETNGDVIVKDKHRSEKSDKDKSKDSSRSKSHKTSRKEGHSKDRSDSREGHSKGRPESREGNAKVRVEGKEGKNKSDVKEMKHLSPGKSTQEVQHSSPVIKPGKEIRHSSSPSTNKGDRETKHSPPYNRPEKESKHSPAAGVNGGHNRSCSAGKQAVTSESRPRPALPPFEEELSTGELSDSDPFFKDSTDDVILISSEPPALKPPVPMINQNKPLDPLFDQLSDIEDDVTEKGLSSAYQPVHHGSLLAVPEEPKKSSSSPDKLKKSRKGSSKKTKSEKKSKDKTHHKHKEVIRESAEAKRKSDCESETKDVVEAKNDKLIEDSQAPSQVNGKSHSPAEYPPTDADYLTVLLDIQQRLMTMTDRGLLQQVVSVIEDTGLYKISDATFDFDLCRLDRNTVHKLQRFLESNI